MNDPIDIRKIKQGDQEAFKHLFESVYPKMMAVACRFVDEQVAQDLVQDVFTSYWEQKTQIEAENIQSFLYKWLQNRCLNYIKHQRIVADYESRIRIAETRIAFMDTKTDANDVLRQVVAQDLREQIDLSLAKLPPKTAEAFRYCYFHELSHKEIAGRMNISVRTVETHIRHAVLLLRKELKDLLLLLFLFNHLN